MALIKALETQGANADPSWTVIGGGVTSVSGSGAGISVSPTSGEVVVANTGVTALVAGANTTLSAATGTVTVSTSGGGGTTVLPGYIWGFTLSNDGTTPNTILDIALGTATDSTGTVTITGTAFTKTISGTWVAGSGNAGMGTGLTATAITWYHVFAGIASGVYDVFFDTSLTAAHKPAAFTSVRYIGDVYLDSNIHITAFTQVGNTIFWATPSLELSGGTATSPVLLSVKSPPGIRAKIMAKMQVSTSVVGGGGEIFSGYDSTNAVGLVVPFSTGYYAFYTVEVITNTSSQIYYCVTNSSASAIITTFSYINPYLSPVAQ